METRWTIETTPLRPRKGLNERGVPKTPGERKLCTWKVNR